MVIKGALHSGATSVFKKEEVNMQNKRVVIAHFVILFDCMCAVHAGARGERQISVIYIQL